MDMSKYTDSENSEDLAKFKLTDENSEDISKYKLTDENSEDLIRFFCNIATVLAILIFIYLFLFQIYKDGYSFEDGRVF